MARAKFKDLKAGRTLYAVTVRIDPDGSKTAMPVETLRICSRPFRVPKIEGVQMQTPRQWQFQMYTKHWFESQPKKTTLFCFVYDFDTPEKPDRADESFRTVVFTRCKEAVRFGQDFVRSYVPTAVELEHACKRDGLDAMLAEHDHDEERELERPVLHEELT
jgi:hypothetical protein